MSSFSLKNFDLSKNMEMGVFFIILTLRISIEISVVIWSISDK